MSSSSISAPNIATPRLPRWSRPRAKIEEGQGELDLGPALKPGRAVVEDQVSRLLVDVITGAWKQLGST